MSRPQGPWVKKLIVRFMSKAAIPDGGGLQDGIKFLSDPTRITEAAKAGTVQAFEAIDRSAISSSVVQTRSAQNKTQLTRREPLGMFGS